MQQNTLWPLMFEPMQDPLQPGLGQVQACTSHRLSNGTHILCGVGKIQNALRILSVVVDKPLEPICCIPHCCHRSRVLQTSSMHFHQGCFFKPWHVGEP